MFSRALCQQRVFARLAPDAVSLHLAPVLIFHRWREVCLLLYNPRGTTQKKPVRRTSMIFQRRAVKLSVASSANVLSLWARFAMLALLEVWSLVLRILCSFFQFVHSSPRGWGQKTDWAVYFFPRLVLLVFLSVIVTECASRQLHFLLQTSVESLRCFRWLWLAEVIILA